VKMHVINSGRDSAEDGLRLAPDTTDSLCL